MIHGDIHPGNIFVNPEVLKTKKGQLFTLIDTGNVINMYSGYGNPVSNTIGTLGLMGACTPWMYFNTCQTFYNPIPMMGGGGFYAGIGMGFNPMMSMGCHRGYWC